MRSTKRTSRAARVVLPAPVAPTTATRRPGPRSRSMSAIVAGALARSRPTRADAAQLQRQRRPVGQRPGARGLRDRCGSVENGDDALAAASGSGEREQHGRQQLDGLEGRDRDQHDDGQRDSVEPVGANGGHRGDQATPDRQTGAECGQPGPQAGGGGRAASDPGQLTVAGVDPGEVVVRGAERDEVGQGPQQVHDLAAQLGARTGQPGLGPPPGPRRGRWYGQRGDEQGAEQHQRGRRQQRCDQADGGGRGGRGHGDRLQHTQGQVLHRIDVIDQPGEQSPRRNSGSPPGASGSRCA